MFANSAIVLSGAVGILNIILFVFFLTLFSVQIVVVDLHGRVRRP